LQIFLNYAHPATEIIHPRCTANHEGDSESLNKIMTNNGDVQLNELSPGPGDYQDFLLHILDKEPPALIQGDLHSFLPWISERTSYW
jgi:hypothetical protein